MTFATLLSPKRQVCARRERVDELRRRAKEARDRADAYNEEVALLKEFRANLVEIAKQHGIKAPERDV